MSRYYIAYETVPPRLPLGVYDSLEELRRDYPSGKCRVGTFYDRRCEEKLYINASDLMQEVREQRLMMDMTLKDLADRIGVSYSLIYYWETGMRRPAEKWQEKLKEWLKEVRSA